MSRLVEVDSLADNELEMKFANWTSLRRMDNMSRSVDRRYKPSDQWCIDDVAFRHGMAIEAMYMARTIAWATLRHVPILSSTQEVYAKIVAASEGRLSLHDSLFLNDEIGTLNLKLGITDDEEKHALEDMKTRFNRICPYALEWWTWWSPELDGLRSAGRSHEDAVNMVNHGVSAFTYARNHADFGRDEVDRQSVSLLRALGAAERVIKEKYEEQKDQVERLLDIASMDNRGLRELYRAAYPNGRLETEASGPAATAAAAAGPTEAAAAASAVVAPTAMAASTAAATIPIV